jgi:hypothetical protein
MFLRAVRFAFVTLVLASLAAALNGTKGDVVSPHAPASGPFVKP